MAVAHSTSTESHTGTTGSTSEASFDISVPFTSSHKGLLVYTFVNANADDATSVKIDPAGANTDVPAVSGGRAVDTVDEPGDCKAWFLGSGLPTTTTTVRINRTNNANVMYAVAITVTAAGATEVYTAGIVLLQENNALGEQNVTDGSPGTDSLRYVGINWGGSNIPTVGTNTTAIGATGQIDFGVRTAATARETTAGQGSRPVGYATITADDTAAVHLAVREAATGNTGTIAVTQAADVGAFTGTVANPITGTISVTQAAQTMAATGTETISGTIGATQDSNVGALTGTVANPVTGTITATQADQTGAFAGTLGIVGTIGANQDPNTGAFSGTVANPITGVLGAVQDDNAAAFLGTVVSDGTLNSIQDDQTGALTGTVANPVSGTIGVTQADQIGSFTGTHTPPTVTGTIAAVQADQVAVFVGDSTSAGVTGTLTATQDDQTAAFTGTVTVNVTGVLATVQANQTATFTGTVANPVSFIVTGTCVLGGPLAACTIIPVVIVAGSNVQITTTFRDANGDLADPSSVSAVVQAPDGTQSTPIPTSSSTGIWVTTIPTDQAGYWFYQITGTGSDIDVVCQGSFCAEASLILV